MGNIKTCDASNACGQGEGCEQNVCCPQAINRGIRLLHGVSKGKVSGGSMGVAPLNGNL